MKALETSEKSAQKCNRLQSVPVLQLRNWLIEKALPLWLQAGFNNETGMAWEYLDPLGKPLRDVASRGRVQTRQCFVLCQALARGWVPDVASQVRRLQHFLDTTARHPEWAFAHMHAFTSHGELRDDRLDTYDLAFLLLACAWQYRALANSASLQQAEVITDFLDTKLADPHGGWLEGLPPVSPRRQNPHMHLLEAFLALYEGTGDARYLRRASNIVDLFERYFYRHDQGVLLEFYHSDWAPQPIDGRYPVEPGHLMEWVCLLSQYATASQQALHPAACKLYESALALGVDTQSNLLFNSIDPHEEILDASKRLWPQTEAIRASLCMARAGHRTALDHATAFQTALFHYYLNPSALPGLYLDRVDGNNRCVVEASPASSLYHLVQAAVTAEDFVLRTTSSASTHHSQHLETP